MRGAPGHDFDLIDEGMSRLRQMERTGSEGRGEGWIMIGVKDCTVIPLQWRNETNRGPREIQGIQASLLPRLPLASLPVGRSRLQLSAP